MYVNVGEVLEKDMILWYGHSAKQEACQIEFPEIPRSFMSDRLELRDMSGVIRICPEERSTIQISLIVNVDPKLQYIPRPLVNFTCRFIVGILLHLMNKHGKMIQKDPYNNIHAIKMREHPNYYHNCLLRAIRNSTRDNVHIPFPYMSALEVDIDCDGVRHYQQMIRKYGLERGEPNAESKD